MDFLFGLVTALFAVLFVVLLAGLARRIPGVPVGWLRTIVFAVVVVSAGSSLLTFVASRAGLISGTQVVVNPATAVLVTVLTVAWMFVLGLAALVILELVLPTGSVPSPLALLAGGGGNAGAPAATPRS
ncbi:hypothetical protein [Amycolatopsis sp. GM8]|uniref:hypothetical protein n=1 Tax=Amycolatopsis sp. GM8 TaxID=2896530 RepID=UPI001F466678|nr:hypothetical protein [Amycolatopsis sp. GM8]